MNAPAWYDRQKIEGVIATAGPKTKDNGRCFCHHDTLLEYSARYLKDGSVTDTISEHSETHWAGIAKRKFKDTFGWRTAVASKGLYLLEQWHRRSHVVGNPASETYSSGVCHEWN